MVYKRQKMATRNERMKRITRLAKAGKRVGERDREQSARALNQQIMIGNLISEAAHPTKPIMSIRNANDWNALRRDKVYQKLTVFSPSIRARDNARGKMTNRTLTKEEYLELAKLILPQKQYDELERKVNTVRPAPKKPRKEMRELRQAIKMRYKRQR